jgi:hypothetical protein
MPQLRGTAETARFGQADKIFKPLGFHGADYAMQALPSRR